MFGRGLVLEVSWNYWVFILTCVCVRITEVPLFFISMIELYNLHISGRYFWPWSYIIIPVSIYSIYNNKIQTTYKHRY
jgi:hypothetical protein